MAVPASDLPVNEGVGMAYFGGRKIGNFKPSITERLKEKRNRDPRADREGNCEKHLSAIRKLPCCVPGCNVVGCDPHHLKSAGERGMGLRAPDRWAVPLCRAHHEEVERIGSRNENRWFLDRGIYCLDLAKALWGVRGDAGAMTRIVLANKAGKA